VRTSSAYLSLPPRIVMHPSCLYCTLFRALPFFFQAEDGIRGFHVTGVQTCALPIFSGFISINDAMSRPVRRRAYPSKVPLRAKKIGRASCRERVELSVVVGVW